VLVIRETARFLTVSRVWQAKIIEKALKAFRIILEDFGTTFCVVVGEGSSTDLRRARPETSEYW